MVSINGFEPANLPLNCGVPRGSTLGPLLFLHINEFKFSSSSSHFADNTCIIYSSKKITNFKMTNFIQKYSILFKRQYGFQTGKSTEHAHIDIQNAILNSLEKKETPCCLFLDFAKAFDTVNHSILLQKHNHYSIHGNALQLFESYLTGSEQCVQVNNNIWFWLHRTRRAARKYLRATSIPSLHQWHCWKLAVARFLSVCWWHCHLPLWYWHQKARTHSQYRTHSCIQLVNCQ